MKCGSTVRRHRERHQRWFEFLCFQYSPRLGLQTGHYWPSCRRATAHCETMQAKRKLALSVRCPTCGAKPGEKCELSTGLPRTEPHRDRRLGGLEKV